jgi:hypothetical protein
VRLICASSYAPRGCVIVRPTLDRECSIRTGGIRPARVTVLGVVLCAAVPVSARAAEVTRVVSGFDETKRFDFNITLGWTHDKKQATVTREFASDAQRPGVELIKDLVYSRARDVMNARIEMGIMPDVGLHVDLPYVIRDDRELDFDQRGGSSCIFPGGIGTPTCVNQQNSTLVRDGILPGTARPVFQGPRRSGLESLGVGFSWAVMNQLRDDTKPTWILGIDAKFDVGTTMRYDAARPDANTGVGLGYHQMLASTFVSKRLGAMDPYFGAYYMLPLPGSESPFDKLPIGSQPYARPQSRVGLQFGFEFIPWERSEINQRVTFEVRTRADHRFQGSSHSELWEPLSGSSACGSAGTTSCRTGVDLDLDGNNAPDRPHPGVTETQAYSTVGGDVGLNVQAGRYTRFRGLFGMTSDLPHFITFGTAGSDRDGDGRVDSTNQGEANPVYREVLDLTGRRFKVEGSRIWHLSIELVAVF